MTLSDLEEFASMEFTENCLHDVGKAARDVMIKACTDHRLTCGVVECAQHLETEPEDVMICILAEVTSQSVSVKIQHTLMEAYCREYGIPVLKVQSVSPLSETLQKYTSQKANVATNNITSAHAQLERKQSNTRDFSCFLIKNPDAMASEDFMLKIFCNQELNKKEVIIKIPS